MDAALEAEVEAAMSGMSADDIDTLSCDPSAVPAGTDDDDPELIKATVVSIQGEDVFIDTGGRAEGVVPVTQFKTPPEVGSRVEVVADQYDSKSGLMIYSREGAVQKATWISLKVGAVVEGRCTGMVKGGLELDVNGIRAFMPTSQCSIERMPDISILLGEKLNCEVIEVDRRAKNVVVSRRNLLERLRKADRDKLLDELEAGQTLSGVVTNLMDYGAFVDLGGVDGLLHISDMSYGHVARASDVVKVGQTLQIKVLKYNREKQRISLGLKQIQPDPWDDVPAKYTEGMQVNGRVVRLTDFGAFVELDPGVDALVPISEMSWTKRLKHPSDMLKVDQVITGQILKVDVEKRRLSVSLKRVEEDPWGSVESDYPEKTVVKGKVTRLADFGAFVELHPGVEGLVHISELSDQHVRAVGDVVKEGQEVECRVLASDNQTRKVSLTMKNVHEEALPTSLSDLPKKPAKKRKKPLRGGLESGGGWFLG